MGLNRVGRLPRRRGKLLSVSNESGHYSPTPSSLQRLMGRLAEMGVARLQDVRLVLIRREAYEVRSEASNSDLSMQPPVPPAEDLEETALQDELQSARWDAADAAGAAVVRRPSPSTICNGSTALWLRSRFVAKSYYCITGLLLPTWLCFSCHAMRCPDVLAPILFGALTTLAFMSAIVASNSDSLPQIYVDRVGMLTTAAVTLQSAHKVAIVLATPAWDLAPVLRLATSVGAAVIVYAGYLSVRANWCAPWTCYRVGYVLAGLEGIVGCVALRTLAGPSVTGYPPGNVSFVSAILCWCEAMAVGSFSTPSARRYLREALTVISLREGVRLNTEAGRGGSYASSVHRSSSSKADRAAR